MPDAALILEVAERAGFGAKLEYPAPEAARIIGCSLKELRRLADAGEIRYVLRGRGEQRQRRVFRAEDLAAWHAREAREGEACRSTDAKAARSGTTISGSTVVAFTARPKRPTRR